MKRIICHVTAHFEDLNGTQHEIRYNKRYNNINYAETWIWKNLTKHEEQHFDEKWHLCEYLIEYEYNREHKYH